MKKLIMMVVLLVVLFAISAVASFQLRKHNADAHGEQAESPTPTSEKSKKGQPNHGTSAPVAGDVRPTIRPPHNPEADNAAQLANNLRAQTEALKTREQQLVTRQKSLEMISQDIRTERAVFDDMRKQLNEELKAVTEKVELLEKKSGEVDSKRKQLTSQSKQIQDSVVRVEESEKENVKRLSTVYDSMDADAAAQLLQHMADTGKIETAAKILTGMRERQAAKVLAAISDRTTVVQLLEKMRTVDRSAPIGNNESPIITSGKN